MRAWKGIAVAVATAALCGQPALADDGDARTTADGDPSGTTVELTSAIGGGAFGSRPMGLFDFGFEFRTERATVGTGVRLRFVGDDGLRTADWDDSSEIARILRYVVIRPDSAGTTSIAVGSLTGIELGEGALVDGYVAGIDADHGHTGATVRVQTERYRATAFVDDIIAPRIAGAQVSRSWNRWQPSIAIATDWQMPRAMTTGEPTTDTWVGSTLATRYRLDDGAAAAPTAWFADAGITSHLGLATAGALHIGTDGRHQLGRTELSGRLELLLGSDRYVPAFIGPLYERDRRADAMDGDRPANHRARIDDGGLTGVSAMTAFGLSIARTGDVELSYRIRNALPDIARARLSFARHTRVQVGVWAAAELAGADPIAGAMALEARFDLPRGFYLSFESARLYRDDGAAFAPLWTHSIAIGATRTAYSSR